MEENNNWKIFVLMLREIAKAKGIEQLHIQEKTGIPQANISKIFNLKVTPRIDTLMNLAEAVGIKFFIEDNTEETNMELVYKNAMTKFEKLK